MSDNQAESNESSEPSKTGASQVCHRCGNALDPTNLGDVCPACLMQVGFESDVKNETLDSETKPTNLDEASPNEDDTLEAVQKLFPGLEILEMIGRGGMGIVYRARQTHLGRLVALKLLRAKCSGDPSLAERFTREARALAKLSHPNIVGVHDFGQAGDRPYLIMEYVDGVNLRSMLESKTLKPTEAMAMVPAICEALQFAHDEGVVHRDIKPENILVDRRGRVRIADFGLARLMTRSKEEWTLTGTRQVMGTPHYMAPEQIEHPQDVDHRADIYSLGVVIYEMLTGELPIGRFELPSNKINVDIRFDDIVLRTLEKEPTRRYQHVTDVQTAVEKIASDTNVALPLLAERPNAFTKCAAYGVIAATVVDVFIAITYLWASLFRSGPGLRFGNGDAFFFGAYHAIIAVVLGSGIWHTLNHGSKYWRIAATVLSIVPIHIGGLAGLPFGILSLILLYVGPQHKSMALFTNESVMEFGAIAQFLKHGCSRTLSMTVHFWKRCSTWIATVWRVAWRKIVRAFLLTLLWSTFCAVASLGIYWFYGHSRFPTSLRISDSSAKTVNLLTSDEIRVRINCDVVRPHRGYAVQPEVLKRSEIQLALYLAAARPDLGTKNYFGDDSPPKVYFSEAFVAHFTTSNTIEYEIRYPYNVHGTIVESSVFRSNPTDKPSVKKSVSSFQASPSFTSRSVLKTNLNNWQYRPTLKDPNVIENWLKTSGLSNEEAHQTAAGIFDLLAELANSGGIVADAAGEARLIPISEMLDKTIFSPQASNGILIDIAPQDWAISAWIGTTFVAIVIGLILFAVLKLRRMSS